MADDTKIKEAVLPTKTYKKTKDVPIGLVTSVYYSAKNITQASKILGEQTMFTDRAWRYALKKMEVQSFLQPELMINPSKRHIDSVNKARAKVDIAPAEMPPTLHEPIKGKKIEEDKVMVTVHLRAESDGLGAKGFHSINLEASYSKILNVNYTMDEVRDMMGHLKNQIVSKENYGALAGIIEYDDNFVDGVEVERVSESHHTDGEIVIPLRPKRSRSE